MKIRHQYTESKSLLLSATPVNIHKLWDSMGKQTNILPDIEHHYPAIHSKKYLINILNEFKYDQSNQNSDLVIFNSIAESQYYKSRISNSQLYHSEFNSQSKKNKYKYLMDNYGKHSKRQIKEETIVSTLIAQASFNISFLNGYESCLSPQATLQRLGRIERFDDYDENPSFTTFKPRDRKSKKPTHSRGEKSVIEIFYDNILMNLWFEELSKYNDNKLTLDEFYVIYNKHLIEYDDKLKKLYNKKYRESLFCLSEIYPIKYKNANKDNIIITAGSNKLRSNGTEIYFIVQKYDNDKEYVGLFSTAIYRNIEQDFNESGDMLRKIIGSMKTIMKTDQTEYDYSEILSNKKYITIDEIRRHAKKSNTPYIRYDKVYHPDYGLITKDNLNNIN